MEVGRKAGFVDAAVLGDRIPLSKDRLKRYPLFSVDFLDWLFTQIPEDQTPIYTAHFRMVKPEGYPRDGSAQKRKVTCKSEEGQP